MSSHTGSTESAEPTLQDTNTSEIKYNQKRLHETELLICTAADDAGNVSTATINVVIIFL